MTHARVAALGAIVAAIGGALAVALAVGASPALRVSGYVSEAGSASYPRQALFQAGMFALAAALALLGVALGRARAVPALLLGAAAVLAVVSGAVPCSDGCPLPPFERATGADLVHGGASILAVGACVFAMLALAWEPTPSRLRTIARAGFVVAGPLSVAVGLSIVVIGRGPTTGLLERVLLTIVVVWVVATGATRVSHP